MAPWAKAYTVDIKDIYTELSLEKIENQPTGPEGKIIENYTELFPESCDSKAAERILFKSDPGFGKTTISKKVSWDWVKRTFTRFALVFLVLLKLVKPGDSVENMIIRQNPVLHSLGVREKGVKSILENFGGRCLIIFDGLDECDFENHPQLLQILNGQSFINCHVMLTSRPHAAAKVSEYFTKVVQIQGFTEAQTKKYLTHVLKTSERIDMVMHFYNENFLKGSSKHASPMLLLFISILDNSNEIDLSRIDVTLGEIYTRLVRCLYRKFTARKGIEYKSEKFREILSKIGFLAWKTLNFKEYLLRKEGILNDVGEDAFEYGLFVGEENYQLMADPFADIVITFVHRSIEEFLGAFNFIEGLNQKITHGFLESFQLISRNHLFLHFGLWFLSHTADTQIPETIFFFVFQGLHIIP